MKIRCQHEPAFSRAKPKIGVCSQISRLGSFCHLSVLRHFGIASDVLGMRVVRSEGSANGPTPWEAPCTIRWILRQTRVGVVSRPLGQCRITLRQRLLDGVDGVSGQIVVAGRGGLGNLLRIAGAHDGGGDLRASERPGDGQLGKTQTLRFGNRFQGLDKLQIRLQPRALKVIESGAVVIRIEIGGALGGEFARQQAPEHRAVADHADVVLATVGQNIGFDITGQHAVRWLQAGDRMDGLRPLHLFDTEIGNAQVTDFACVDAVDQRAPALFNVLIGLGPVQLHQVDDVDTQPLEAGIDFRLDAVCFQRAVDAAVFFPAAIALGGDHGATRRPQLFKSLTDHDLGMPQAIDRGGIDPVDALINGSDDRGNGLIIILPPPTEKPATAAHGPGSQADAGDIEFAVTKFAGFHGRHYASQHGVCPVDAPYAPNAPNAPYAGHGHKDLMPVGDRSDISDMDGSALYRCTPMQTNSSTDAGKSRGTVLFAGGGTGGHIFPSVAIDERLREAGAPFQTHFLISTRPLDAEIIQKHGAEGTACAVMPLSTRPWKWPGFLGAWFKAVRQVRQLMSRRQVRAVVAMGGFVCGPAVAAARRAGIPVALVNLDAVPGIANRHLARKATTVFSVYESELLPGARPIGLPLRRSAVGARLNGSPQSFEKHAARQSLGLHPDRQTLLVVGGSQGAQSINQALARWFGRQRHRRAMGRWQVLHICGKQNRDQVTKAYESAGVKVADNGGPPNGGAVKVLGFCDSMGAAWTAADVAISRSGAGSVAEAWANRTPTIFLPYPFHRDDHQRLNAEPLVDAGGALLIKDQIDPKVNARKLSRPLLTLAADVARRREMIQTMQANEPADGAAAVARWVITQMVKPFD